MKIVEVKELSIPGVKVIKFDRFYDHRGYFTESFRMEQLREYVGDWNVHQANESFSKKNTVRGLHFQWDPYMGKLVRVIQGEMMDIALDIRKNSPTYGKVLDYYMCSDLDTSMRGGEWIWLPKGIAHGNVFLKDTIIEYFCSGSYNSDCEAGISPLADDLNWEYAPYTKCVLETLIKEKSLIITSKDMNNFSLKNWENNENFGKFSFDVDDF